MKKVFSLLPMVLWVAITYCQNFNVTSASNSIQAYTRERDRQALEKGREFIDKAAAHESTKAKGKTWYYRGLIYQLIYEDSLLHDKYPYALDTAYASYIKALKVNDPKFRDEKNVLQNLSILAIHYHNAGVDFYKQAQYDRAYHCFTRIVDIKNYLKERGFNVKDIEDQTALLNAALAAQKLGDKETAKKLYRSLVEADFDNPAIYQALANIYKEEDSIEAAMAVIAKGIERYPKNIGLIIDELNIYLAENRHAEVIAKLKKAIALQPDNVQLYYALGSAYDNLGMIDSAIVIYKKAIEVDPQFYDIYNNLGALYYNQAIEINKQMNEITGFSAADQKKYKELEARRNELYQKALPYFEKAHELKPDALEIMVALKEIYAKMGDYEKSNEMKRKIELLKAGQ